MQVELLELGRRLNSANRLNISGLSEAAREWIVHSLLNEAKHKSTKLVLVCRDERQFSFWLPIIERSNLPTGLLPAVHLWGADRQVNPLPLIHQRMGSLHLLQQPYPAAILTTAHALSARVMHAEDLKKATQLLKKGDEIDIDVLRSHWQSSGYVERKSIEESGQYAIRGGVVDIFPPQRDEPVRLELFGDEIETLRCFRVEDQRSFGEALDEVQIPPAMDVLLRQDHREQDVQRVFDYLIAMDTPAADRDGLIRSMIEGHTIKDLPLLVPVLRERDQAAIEYCDDQTCIVLLDAQDACMQSFQETMVHLEEQYRYDLRQSRVTVDPMRHFLSTQWLSGFLQSHDRTIDSAALLNDKESLSVLPPVFPPFAIASQEPQFDKWMEWITQLLEDDHRICITSLGQAERVRNLFEHRDLRPTRIFESIAEASHQLADTSLSVCEGSLSGIVSLTSKTHFIPDFLLFGRRSQRQRQSQKKKLKNLIGSFRELQVGGLVVHVDHGIGRYLGITTLTVGGSKVDCLLLEYAGGDRVYLPVDRLQLLQRYTTGAGEEGKTAALDKLKGLGWQKRKSNVKKTVRDMADQLLRIQAQRELASGLPFHTKTDRYLRFEAEFSYVETEDQIRAIADVNGDMEKSRPMDRLICGDVGFGKTEVALRAAFRAVESGYQVLVLVPTTVLCYQHYRQFHERMNAYGIRVAQLNRFVKPKDVQTTLSQLATAQIDIVVGTHRLLSQDVKPQKLGLMIVDEEQRFGVGHKEALKSLRAGCHVLTLTATPIPRTLHMAMLGLRDISIIATAPQNRLSVKTYISKWDDVLVKEAIESELHRGGQVFFLHNRVEDIATVRQKIKDLVPSADVRFAHGQMSEEKLEQVILDFIEAKFNVLVCTTIIESGIDMPNVNTLIVNQAQQFGLAQLYQIRGRVGRSTRQAYAYFMVPSEEKLADESRKRLEVLSMYQQLGSGFQVARHDLEIRGAGNLLGAEQSGKIDEVGLELYTDMLSQAISEVRGVKVKERIDPEIKIHFAASIPGTYIDAEQLRLDLYKRMFTAESLAEMAQLREEIKDRFGPPVEEVELLCRVAELKVILRQLRVTQLSRSDHGMSELKFSGLQAEDIQRITSITQKNPRAYQLTADFRLLIAIPQIWSFKLEHQLEYIAVLTDRLLPLYLAPTEEEA